MASGAWKVRYEMHLQCLDTRHAAGVQPGDAHNAAAIACDRHVEHVRARQCNLAQVQIIEPSVRLEIYDLLLRATRQRSVSVAHSVARSAPDLQPSNQGGARVSRRLGVSGGARVRAKQRGPRNVGRAERWEAQQKRGHARLLSLCGRHVGPVMHVGKCEAPHAVIDPTLGWLEPSRVRIGVGLVARLANLQRQQAGPVQGG